MAEENDSKRLTPAHEAVLNQLRAQIIEVALTPDQERILVDLVELGWAVQVKKLFFYADDRGAALFARYRLGKARFLAYASGTCSLICILSGIALIVFLFLNWRISLLILAAIIPFAILAYHLNGMKNQVVFGPELGKYLNKLDWEHQRRLLP